MKANVYAKYGTPDVLRFKWEFEKLKKIIIDDIDVSCDVHSDTLR